MPRALPHGQNGDAWESERSGSEPQGSPQKETKLEGDAAERLESHTAIGECDFELWVPARGGRHRSTAGVHEVLSLLKVSGLTTFSDL